MVRMSLIPHRECLSPQLPEPSVEQVKAWEKGKRALAKLPCVFTFELPQDCVQGVRKQLVCQPVRAILLEKRSHRCESPVVVAVAGLGSLGLRRWRAQREPA